VRPVLGDHCLVGKPPRRRGSGRDLFRVRSNEPPTGLYIEGLETRKDRRKAAGEAVDEPEAFDDPPQFSNGRVGPYSGRSLPGCCPEAASLTLGTTIRIARPHHPCCLTWRTNDLQFLRTVNDRW
jgi:hypothetical protein